MYCILGIHEGKRVFGGLDVEGSMLLRRTFRKSLWYW